MCICCSLAINCILCGMLKAAPSPSQELVLWFCVPERTRIGCGSCSCQIHPAAAPLGFVAEDKWSFWFQGWHWFLQRNQIWKQNVLPACDAVKMRERSGWAPLGYLFDFQKLKQTYFYPPCSLCWGLRGRSRVWSLEELKYPGWWRKLFQVFPVSCVVKILWKYLTGSYKRRNREEFPLFFFHCFGVLAGRTTSWKLIWVPLC